MLKAQQQLRTALMGRSVIAQDLILLQLVIYGINADVVPPEFINFTSTLYTYLEFVLKPGGAEVPAGLVLSAVEAGATPTVAAAFNEAVQLGYSQQLVAILKQVWTCILPDVIIIILIRHVSSSNQVPARYKQVQSTVRQSYQCCTRNMQVLLFPV